MHTLCEQAMYEAVLSLMFSEAIEKREQRDHFYFVLNPKWMKMYKKMRRVCRLWNEILLRTLPNQKCIAVNVKEKQSFNNFGEKLESCDSVVFYRSFGTCFHSSEVYELFGEKITSIYMKELICGSEWTGWKTNHIIQEVVRQCPNLKQLLVSRCWWVGGLKISSRSLENVSVDIPDLAALVSVRCNNMRYLTMGYYDGIPTSSISTNLKISVKSQSPLLVNLHHIKRALELRMFCPVNINMNICFCKFDSLSIQSSPIDQLYFYKNKVKHEMHVSSTLVKVFHVLKPVRLQLLDVSKSKVVKLNYDINVKSAQVIFGRPSRRLPA